MRFSCFLLIVVMTATSCNQNIQEASPDFDYFVFSHSEMHGNYSIKFTKSDTIFLEKRLPEKSGTFYSVIPKASLLKLDSFLNKINFE